VFYKGIVNDKKSRKEVNNIDQNQPILGSLRGSLAKSGPLDFATKNSFSLSFCWRRGFTNGRPSW